mmetsp:Transcript_33790/g.66900  ORF Transcript_33790/g.66900 Transcript_33790/m.66900 type:complete len:117 (-) Transcript_33790:722-1072(-)
MASISVKGESPVLLFIRAPDHAPHVLKTKANRQKTNDIRCLGSSQTLHAVDGSIRTNFIHHAMRRGRESSEGARWLAGRKGKAGKEGREGFDSKGATEACMHAGRREEETETDRLH